MIEKYEIYYRETVIGYLHVDTERRLHRYIPRPEGVEEVDPIACLLRVMKEGQEEFGEVIPFFDSRLFYMKRSGRKIFGYHTDHFTFKLLEDEDK